MNTRNTQSPDLVAYIELTKIFSKYAHYYNRERVLRTKTHRTRASNYGPKENDLKHLIEIQKRLHAKAEQGMVNTLSNAEITALFKKIPEDHNLSEEQARHLHLMWHEFIEQNALSEEDRKLDEALTNKVSYINSNRKDLPWAGEIAEHYHGVHINWRKKGLALQKEFDYDSPYEALVNIFAPGTHLKTVMEQVDLLNTHNQKIMGHMGINNTPVDLTTQEDDTANPFLGLFTKEEQINLVNEIAEEFGMDRSKGSIREGTAPYCTGTPFKADALITVHDDVLQTILVGFHESRHANYNHNLPRDIDGTLGLFARDAGKAAQEAPAMHGENFMVRTPAFMHYLEKKITSKLEEKGKNPPVGINANTMYNHVMQVNHSHDRKSADPLTFMAHIAHRIELGQHFFDQPISDLSTFEKDFPKAWQDLQRKALNLEPAEHHSQECTQDYQYTSNKYPAYYISYFSGEICAAHIDTHLRSVFPDMDKRIENADMADVNQWWIDNFYSHGNHYTLDDLVERATGERPNIKYLIKSNYERYAPELITPALLQGLGFDDLTHPQTLDLDHE